MRKLLTIFAIAATLGLFATASFANELAGPENISNPFPEYTTIND
jgi:hypothetical protein